MIIILFSLVVLLWLIATYFLTGEDLSKFDKSLESSANDIFDSHSEDQENNQKMILRLGEARQQAIKTKSIFKGLQVARDFADELSIDLVTDTEFRSINANNVECEWAIAPNVDMNKRVVFFHGGAFLLGSAKGHRKFADQLSRLSNAPVLSVNYRMLPKYSRMLGIKDAQQAYLWALENGPDGKQPLDFIMVSGDSAGGNLAHMVTQWSIQNAPRKPDCLISFSPSLDQTFTCLLYTSPSPRDLSTSRMPSSA